MSPPYKDVEVGSRRDLFSVCTVVSWTLPRSSSLACAYSTRAPRSHCQSATMWLLAMRPVAHTNRVRRRLRLASQRRPMKIRQVEGRQRHFISMESAESSTLLQQYAYVKKNQEKSHEKVGCRRFHESGRSGIARWRRRLARPPRGTRGARFGLGASESSSGARRETRRVHPRAGAQRPEPRFDRRGK